MEEKIATRLQPNKADYGIDAPDVIRNFYFFGIALIIGGWFIPPFSFFGFQITWFGLVLMLQGVIWVTISTLMILYAKKGKFKHRDRMLNMINWCGNEIVLDVGTGRGLLMIGAAKRLTTGKSIGIDIWNAEDLSGNKQENTLRNICVEGVEEKVELKSEDVREMSFADNTFDVVLSNLCIHNLYQPEQREQACREIARVLKSGGTALISDFRHTEQYAEILNASGLKVELLGPYWKDTFPKLSIVVARKIK